MLLAKVPWQSSLLYIDADIWLQIVGDQQVPSIPIIAPELWCVCIPICRSVSVFFSAEFNFTGSVFHLYSYFTAYNEK